MNISWPHAPGQGLCFEAAKNPCLLARPRPDREGIAGIVVGGRSDVKGLDVFGKDLPAPLIVEIHLETGNAIDCSNPIGVVDGLEKQRADSVSWKGPVTG